MDEAALIGFSRELSRVLGGRVACMALERGILELGCARADEDDEKEDGDDDDDEICRDQRSRKCFHGCVMF